MTHFRSKLAVILVDSKLNDDEIRNRNFDDDDDDESKSDPTDCMIVEGPSKKLKTSNPPSQVELTSQSFLHLPSASLSNEDLIDELCSCISMVDDVSSLE